MAPAARLLLLLALTALCVPALAAKKVTSARKEDVKFIRCGVCDHMVKQLDAQVKAQKEAIAPKKLTEFQIIEIAENICSLKKAEGEWMMRIDIVEAGTKLELVEQSEEGECKTECKTIERACQEVMGDHDTDVAESIYNKHTDGDALHNLLCKDLSKACKYPAPPVPKNRAPGEPFSPKSSKDAEIERLMRSMSDIPGAGGMKMYSKDDLLSWPGVGGDDGDQSEHEEDEEDDFDEDAYVSPPVNSRKPNAKASGWRARRDLILSGIGNVVSSATRQFQDLVTNAKSLLRSIAPAANVEL